MFESITQFFQKFRKSEKEESKSTAKERLHLVLAQDRANISADFLEMMKQEIIEVIKKYIDIDEKAIDVRLTNKEGEDGKIGAPALYANIPIITIKNEARKVDGLTRKDNGNQIEDEKAKNDIINESKEQADIEQIEKVENNENIDQDKNKKNEEFDESNKKQKVETEEEISSTPNENDNKNLEEVDNEKKDS